MTAAMLCAFYHRHFHSQRDFMFFLAALGYFVAGDGICRASGGRPCVRILGSTAFGSWGRITLRCGPTRSIFSQGNRLYRKGTKLCAGICPRLSLLVLITLACVASGALLYRFVEVPFMAIRSRRFPTNFADGSARAQQAAPTFPQRAP